MRSGRLTPAFSGPQRGRNCYTYRALSGLPNKGDKIKSGYVTSTFSGVPDAKRGAKIGLATSPVPSQGPKRGRTCYATPALSGVPDT